MRLNHINRPGRWMRSLKSVAESQARVRELKALRQPGGSNTQIDILIHVEANRTNSQRHNLDEIVWW